MTASPDQTTGQNNLPKGIGFIEFIILVGFLTSVVALSIDTMLPALPLIGAEYGLGNANDRQLVIVAFVFSFGPAQLLFGPLSDSFGRRPVLLFGLVAFALSSFVAAGANSFGLLLAARVAQGITAAAVRISSNAIIRDCFSGREMARAMSLMFTVFILVPIAAPALGQFIITVSDWHMIFVMFAIAAMIMAIWYAARFTETLPRHYRRPMRARPVLAAFVEIVSNRLALGYTLALTLFFGGLFSFIISVQQIIEQIYGLQEWFAAIFAITSSAIGIASLSNAALVRRYGMRRISHVALFTFAIFGIILLIWTLMSQPPFLAAIGLLCAIMCSFGFVAGNFNAIAMEPLGHIAGAASAMLGMISFTGGAILGAVTGRMFDGTLLPVAVAFSLYGVCAIAIVLWTERGKLFGMG